MKKKREYVRDRKTGELGWLSADGKEVLLDRGSSLHRRKYNPLYWIQDEWASRPLSPGQIAQTCWESAMLVAKVLGVRRKAYVEWVAMDVDVKARVVAGYPEGIEDEAVRDAFIAVWGILKEFKA